MTGTKIYKTVIPESEGTIGKVYTQGHWYYESNTYAAKEGTVIEIDLKLKHQSVLFIPFKDEKGTIISILLVSVSPKEGVSINCECKVVSEQDSKNLEEELSPLLENNQINSWISFAYRTQSYDDIINNFKQSKLDAKTEITPETFLKEHLLTPLIGNLSQIAKIPYVEISNGTMEPIIGISETAYTAYESHLKKNFNPNILGVEGLTYTIQLKYITLKYVAYYIIQTRPCKNHL